MRGGPGPGPRGLWLLAFLALPAGAATYAWLGDDELLARSALVIRGRAVSARPVAGADGLVCTLVGVEVLETLKGETGPRVEVLLPGGVDGDRGFLVPGVPALEAGEEAVLFLARRPDGIWALSELGLSKFEILRAADGTLWATRAMFLSGEVEVEGARPLTDFLGWIRGERELATRSSPVGPLLPRPGQPFPRWSHFNNIVLRWPWDLGAPTATVRYQPATGQTNLLDGSDGIALLTAGTGSWKGVPATDIRTGAPSAGTGGSIQITLDDLTGGSPQYVPPCWTTALCGGGVQGCAGVSYSGSHTHDGLTNLSGVAGKVFVRKYACTTSAVVFQTVVAHEFGHVLGLGHPDLTVSVRDPDQVLTSPDHCLATMRSCLGASCSGGCAAYSNLRTPFALGEDDRKAVRYLYPNTSSAVAVTAVSPNQGPAAGGAPVTISGTGFQAGATVLFGGTGPVEAASVGATTLTVTTPAHATGTVDVVVANPDASAGALPNGYFFVPAPSAARFYALSPCRLFDTRNATGADAASPALVAGTARVFAIAGRCAVPAGATSLSVNVTVTGPGAKGELVLYPGNGVRPVPGTSTLSFPAGVTRANSGQVLLSTDGSRSLGVFNNSGAAAHLILDVTGYFQ